MKGVYLLILLAFFSCQKNKRYCWSCKQDGVVVRDGKSGYVPTVNHDFCDKTKSEIEYIEQTNTTNNKDNDSNYSSFVFKCIKK